MPDVDRRLTRRRLVVGGAAGLLGIAGADLFLEPSHPQTVRVGVPIRGLARSFDGYRIALFADVHWPRNIDRTFTQRIVRMVAEESPDLVAISGDICDLKRFPGPLDLAGVFDGLTAPDGVVGTLGNHDHVNGRAAEIRRQIAKNTPIDLIDHEHRVIRRGADSLVIGGVGDYWHDHSRPEKSFRTAPAGPRVLLAHNPDQPVDEKWDEQVALTLSGHTHGGEVRLPLLGALVLPVHHKWMDQGLKRTANGPVYVTRGIGSPRRARFRCRPEVTVITLECA